MSILNVNKINPVGGGSTITIAGIASVTNAVSVGNSVTASAFYGDGSNLTGAGPTLTNGADNRVVTATGANALNGEANMTFDGSTLTLTPGSSAGNITSLVLGRTSSAPAAQTTAVVAGGIPVSGVPGIVFGSTNTNLPAIGFQTPNSSNGHIIFNPKGSEKFRIGSSGQIGLSGANYGSSGQVLTSGGSGSAPTWSTVASGGASNISFNSGYGIDFSATADGTGSSQAEILDDYEEGAWSPTVSSGNASFSTLLGRYVKVGRQVTLWYRIAGGSGYSGSSALGIQGIPFSNSTAMNPIGTAEFYKIDFARDYSDHCTVYLAGSTIRWLRNSSGGGSGNYLTINLFYSGAAITGMLTYETNS